MCAYNWFLCVHMEISRKIHVKFLIVMASRDSDQISFNRKLIFLTCISITVAVSWNKIDVRLKEMESPKSLFSQHLLKKKKKNPFYIFPVLMNMPRPTSRGVLLESSEVDTPYRCPVPSWSSRPWKSPDSVPESGPPSRNAIPRGSLTWIVHKVEFWHVVL